MRILLALLFCLSAPALAQQIDGSRYEARFAACAHTDGAAPGCVGSVSGLCMEETQGGYTNAGMTACTLMENDLWDAVLNAEWPEHRAAARALDKAEAPYHGGAFTDAADRLLAAQRAWITFRDADCAAAAARFGSGSMRHTTHAACLLDHTASRVLELRVQWGEY